MFLLLCMSFLQIEDLSLDILQDGAAEVSQSSVGTTSRGHDGLLATSESGRKREWACTTVPLLDAAAEELLAIAKPGFFRTCRGALFGGDGYARIIDCLVELEDEVYEVTADGGHVRSFRIRLLEG